MKWMYLCVALGFSLSVQAQSADKSISRGNDYYRQSQFDLAEKQYRLALNADSTNITARYNLANALYRQKRYDEAEALLKNISAQSRDQKVRSAAYYNTGVLYSRQKELEASIEAYKNALRLNPSDEEARENLQKALIELKQKQEQQRRDQQEAQNRQSQMNQKEAERKLQQLQEKEKQIRQRMQSQSGNPMPQDW